MTRTSDLEWAALSSDHTVRASYEIARAAISCRVSGDLVECGVFAGANAAAMARAIIDSGETFRRVHLFDSFAGCPAGGANDIGWTHKDGVSACSKEQLLEYMAAWSIPRDLLVIHEGLFADTVPRFSGAIAVLRLDGDLYESTKVCIEHLYPRIVPGGWCIIDDWDLPGCRKAIDEVMNGRYGPVYFQRHNV